MSNNHEHHEQNNLFHKKVEYTEEKTAFPNVITKKIFILETCVQILAICRYSFGGNSWVRIPVTSCVGCGTLGNLNNRFVLCFPAYKNANNATVMS